MLQSLKTRTTAHSNIDLEINTYRPPKPFDRPTQHLFHLLKKIDPTLQWQESGGVCDGNTLAATGLPTIDTFGGMGNHIHTHNEYVDLDSISLQIDRLVQFLLQIEKNSHSPKLVHEFVFLG